MALEPWSLSWVSANLRISSMSISCRFGEFLVPFPEAKVKDGCFGVT